jgi:hypothetical protein
VEALKYVHHYSEEIGYRIVGTPEMDQTIEYTLEVIKQIKDHATNPNLEIEISRQRGDGHHLFEFMGKVSCQALAHVIYLVSHINNISISS